MSLYQTWLMSKTSNNKNSSLHFEELEKTLYSLEDSSLILTSMDRERLLYEPYELAKQTLRKLCPLFYPDASDKNLKDCLVNPRQHFYRRPSHHIDKIVTTKPIQDRQGNIINVPVGTYVDGINGSLEVGGSTKDSLGIRSADATGDSVASAKSRHWEWGIKFPGFVGLSHGNSSSESESEFHRRMYSEMATTFRFGYAEIKHNSLKFNSLTLAFDAKITPCVLAISYRNPNHQFHICTKYPHYAQLKERWYFVADLNAKNGQFISDPGRIGDSRGPRIIRGRFNFNHFWKQVTKKSSRFIHATALYPDESDVIRRHLLQIKRRKYSLFNNINTEEYHFFPGLLNPTYIE